MNWIKLFENLEDNAIFFEPVTDAKLKKIKDITGIEVSGQLLDLLMQSNGIRDKRFGDYLVYGSDQIVDRFEMCSEYHFKSPRFDRSRTLLFFAYDGCGDYFGYEANDGIIISPQIGFFYPIAPDEYMTVAPDLYTWATKWFTDTLPIWGK